MRKVLKIFLYSIVALLVVNMLLPTKIQNPVGESPCAQINFEGMNKIVIF